MFSKPAEVQGREKFSLGSVFVCGSSDREARKLSEAREREATMLRSSLERLQQCCCVLVLRIRTSLSGKNRRKLREKVTKKEKKKTNTFARDRVTIGIDRSYVVEGINPDFGLASRPTEIFFH